MTLNHGTKLGRYEIRSQLGAGGMGEVYLAVDTELDRTVAIKILPEPLASDQQRLQRFIQEAKAVSALNHPHILTIHEIGTLGTSRFIATEFIEGDTLRQRISTGIKLVEILEIVIQAASALVAAHEAGIIHRDIKPENIMVRRDGIVKVLDFGLAKLTACESTTVDTQAPTRFMTDPGMVLGTANYMSPEQARGITVDARTDVFSFGIVLYEMVTGCPPFAGTTSNEVIASILSENEPQPLARYARESPAELQRIVSKALRKNRDERYQTIRDMLIDLKSLKQELEYERKLERSVPPQAKGGVETVRTGIKTGGEGADFSTPKSIRVNKPPTRSFVISIAALFIIGSTIGAYFYFSHSHRATINSIAILPFASASNDPNTEYLSDGITESLINSLSQVPNLRMIARSSVFRYKGKEVDPQVVGRELGVQAIMTGRITRLDDNLFISAELVDARDNSHLWGERYNRKVSDIFQLQEEISRGISENLRLKLTGEEKQRLTKRYTGNAEAYQLYLQGRYYLNNFERLEEANRAIGYFERAIAMDPNYALAYAGLAEAYILLGEPFNVGLPPKEALREAKAAATKALDIDGTLSEAHLSLAHVIALHEWDWLKAEREYKRATELNPNSATAHRGYSVYLQQMGRHSEAIAEIRRAAELDPLNDLIKANFGFVFYTAREYDQAIEQFKRVGQHIGLGWAYEEKKMYQEAIAELQKGSTVDGTQDLVTASLGHAYALSGKRIEAQKLLDDLQGRSKERYVSPYLISKIYIGLDEKDQAFAWLGKGYDAHDQWMVWLKSDPQMDSLRSDPRFVELVRRVGL